MSVPRRLRDAALLLLVLAAGGLLFAAAGGVPVGASAGHWAPTEGLLRFVLRRSVSTRSRFAPRPPPLDDARLVLKGAGHFESYCRSCHGAPGLPRPPTARYMLPPPPPLSDVVPRRAPEELFYVVKHGLKFTGMPAWPAQGRDDEVWAMVAFLRRLPSLEAEGYESLARGAPGPAEGPSRLSETLRSCARCHGPRGEGRGDGAAPPLGGQPAAYLEGALAAYAAGERHSGTMESVASALSPGEMRELAAYFSGRRSPPPRPASDPAAVERGEALARRGLPARGVPACASCHGLARKDTRGEYPALAGLPAGYIVLQLELLREQRRGGSPYVHLMSSVARRLRPEDIRDAAAYYETLGKGR